MMRKPVFWVMYLMFVMVAAGGLMATAQLAPIAKDFKIDGVPVSIIGLALPALTFALDDRPRASTASPVPSRLGVRPDRLARLHDGSSPRAGSRGHPGADTSSGSDPVLLRDPDRPWCSSPGARFYSLYPSYLAPTPFGASKYAAAKAVFCTREGNRRLAGAAVQHADGRHRQLARGSSSRGR
jgi:hypothetical protein